MSRNGVKIPKLAGADLGRPQSGARSAPRLRIAETSAGRFDERHASAGWRSVPLRLALAAIPLWLTASVLIFNVGWTTKLIVAVVLGVSLAAPGRGLLVTAALAPLGHLIAPLVGPGNFRISEAVVLAFLVGWLLRALPDRPGPRVSDSAAGWMFAATIGASIVGLAWHVRSDPGALSATLDQLVHAYYLDVGDPIGFAAGARLLEGLALVAATVALFRREPRLAVTLAATMTASAATAALSSVLLWRGIGSPLALEQYGRIGYRVSAHVADVNASGSYFAMTLCLALGMAARARGRGRVMWMAGVVATSTGLWFSESRSAFAAIAVVVSLAAAWSATTRWSARARAGALLALLCVVLTLGYARTRRLDNDPTYKGAGFRGQFNASSLRMIAARPVFGVGVGQYYPMSAFFLSPQLAWTYGTENAHNYFLQVGGELGVVGLALLIAWLGAVFAQAARAIAIAPRDWRLLGAAGGVATLCGTCLTGHPLLVDEVMAPFWMLFGLTAGLAGSTLLNADENGSRAWEPQARWTGWMIAATAVAAVLVWTVSDAAQRPLSPPASEAVDGFHGWETARDGARFRWSGQYSSVFVPDDVTMLQIPVRVPAVIRNVTPSGIEVSTGGITIRRTLVSDAWTLIDVPLDRSPAPAHFRRINLRTDTTWRPALYVPGSAELRPVGMQVGELRLVRD
jgi:O-antigen ligase